jgi:SSS family solute:Na+ symporter
MVLPKKDPEIPWTALVIGLWIPNFYYWGLNQYITQRTLGSKSLAEGQKGIVFAAGLKLIIPFIIVFPGMIAFNLYSADMKTEASDNNAEILAVFEQVRSNPATAKVAFEFDRQFPKMYEDTAKTMVAFNAAVAGVEPTTDVTLHEANEEVLGAIKNSNKNLPKAERVAIQNTLLGYKFDSAFALLIKKLVPIGLRGFILAAIMGAVMSSLASMLNSASTIFTMDLYNKYIKKGASQANLVTVGRICVGVFAVIGCIIAPLLDNPKFGGVFKYIQEFQGYISPGILAVFVFGFLVRKAPPVTGVVGLILNPIMYFILAQVFPKLAFLDRMAISFFAVLAVMGVITMVKPLKEPVKFPVKSDIDMNSSGIAKVFGLVVVVITIGLYIFFW